MGQVMTGPDTPGSSRPRRLGRCLALILLAIAGGGSYWAGWRAPKPNQGLAVSEDQLYFGEIWETDRFAWSFDIRNDSGSAIEVEDFVKSCSCVTISPRAFVLPPKQQQRISLIVDLTAKVTPTGHDKKRPFDVQLAPQLKDRPLGPGWTFGALVKHAINSSEPYLELGEMIRSGTEAITRDVPFLMEIPSSQVKDVIPVCAPEIARTSVEHVGAQNYVLRVSPSLALPQGQLLFPVALDFINEHGAVFSTSKVWVKGLATNELQAFPSQLVLGVQSPGSRVRKTVLFRSVTSRPFSVQEIRCPPAMKISAHRGKNQIEQLFDISADITGERDQELIAHFSCQHSDQKTVIIPFRVYYFGRR